jgi:hypothetical protein
VRDLCSREDHPLTREARVDSTGLLTMTTSQGRLITRDAGGFDMAVGVGEH